jgi:antitoxin YefM
MTTQVSLADARAKLSELVGRTEDHHERFVLTVRGEPAAILLGIYDFESMVETLDILSDAETAGRLKDAEEDVAAGRVETLGKST